MVPAFASKDNPAGSEPTVMDQMYGFVPSEAARVTVVYVTPTVPLGSVGAVVIVGPATIVREIGKVAVPPAPSVTCTVKLDVPSAADVGVPLSEPPVDKVRPAGKDPPVTDQV